MVAAPVAPVKISEVSKGTTTDSAFINVSNSNSFEFINL